MAYISIQCTKMAKCLTFDPAGSEIDPSIVKKISCFGNDDLEQLNRLDFDEYRHCKSLEISNTDGIVFKKNLKLTGIDNIYYHNNHDIKSTMEFLDIITGFKNLRTLKILSNGIEALPKCISKLTQLEILDCSENRITCLPDSIGKMKNLTMNYLEDKNE